MAKQKKQQSKFKRFISWFKPTSPAKGALLFAIAFAVIGGSYMAYRTFAHEKIAVANGARQFTCSSYCTPIDHGPDTQKANRYEVKISRGVSSGEALTTFEMKDPWNRLIAAKSRVCLFMHAASGTSGTWAYFDINIIGSGVGGNTGEFFVPASNSYSTYCMPWIIVPGGGWYGAVKVNNVRGAGPSDLFVSGGYISVDL